MIRRTAGKTRLGSKLVLFSLILLIIPWLGYQYIREMTHFLVEGQEKAQLLAAEAIATVLRERTDLFSLGDDVSASLLENTALYAYPLNGNVIIDGYFGDWGELIKKTRHYGDESVIFSRQDTLPDSVSFDLVMGIHGDYLYAAVHVIDDRIVYRHPAYRRLDNSDHLRLILVSPEGENQHLVLTTEGSGTISAYQVQDNWKYALDGRAVSGILGIWQEHSHGYDVEFRIPLALLGKDRRFMLRVADVDDVHQRQVTTEIGSLPSQWSKELNHIIIRSPDIERILSGLEHADSRLWIVDRHRRVRAEVGAIDEDDEESNTHTDRISPGLIQAALEGEAGAQRRSVNGSDIITVTHPIYAGTNVIGAVMLEKGVRELVAMQWGAFQKVAILTILAMLSIAIGFALYSMRLSWRIRTLSRETIAAIDDEGRVTADTIQAQSTVDDGLGDLSRSITDMLQRLNRYTGFLENIPRTLRHEIKNPLNVISTSLQNLAANVPAVIDNPYMESAERGITRLDRIMINLTEAASMEDSLRSDEQSRFDVDKLVREYVASCIHTQTHHQFDYQGPPQGIIISGVSYRIEQLLDKLIDNAVGLSPDGSTIVVQLRTQGAMAILSVINEGPGLPEQVLGSGFDTMWSSRSSVDDSPHLGIGLYIVQTIARHHKGYLKAENCDDGRNVRFSVYLSRDRVSHDVS